MFAAVGREEARAVHRLLAHEHRRQHRGVAVRRASGRARSGRAPSRAAPCRRAMKPKRAPESRAARSISKPADLGVLRAGRGRGRPSGGSPRRPRRCRRRGPCRRAGSGPSRASPSRSASAARELRLGDAQLLLDLVQLGELLRRRLALQLLPRRAARRRAGTQRAPALVGGEQRVEALGRALAGERGAEPASGSLRAARRSITNVSLEPLRSRRRRPAPRPAGRPSRRPPSRAGARSRRRSPKPPQPTSSTSFSPSPKQIVCARGVKPMLLGEEVEPGALREPECSELEEVRQRLRDRTAGRRRPSPSGSRARRARRGRRRRRSSSAASSSQSCTSPTAVDRRGPGTSRTRATIGVSSAT